jgi:hypothetical protein
MLEAQQEKAAAEAEQFAVPAPKKQKKKKKRSRPGFDDEEEYGDEEDAYDLTDTFLAPEDEENINGEKAVEPEFLMKSYPGFNVTKPQQALKTPAIAIPVDDDEDGEEQLEREREQVAARHPKRRKPLPLVTHLNPETEVIEIDREEEEKQSLALWADTQIAKATQTIESHLDLAGTVDPSKEKVEELLESLETIACGGLAEVTPDGLIEASRYFQKLYNLVPSLINDPSDIMGKIITAARHRAPSSAYSSKPTAQEVRYEQKKRQRQQDSDDMNVDDSDDDLLGLETGPPMAKRRKVAVMAPKRGVPVNRLSADQFFDSNQATKLAREKEKAARSYIDDHMNASMSASDSQPTQDGFEVGETPKSGKKVHMHPELALRLQDHQKEAARLMWARCIGFSEEGTGFILAHCMGLGKTISAISLVVTFLLNRDSWKGCPAAPKRRAVIIAPSSLMLNWAKEIREWTARGVYDTKTKLVSA